MGYLLPINPIQSQQYANRITMDPYNFATINRVQRVKLKSDFLEEFEESVELQRIKNRKDWKNPDSAPPCSQYHGYVYPNPVNLSPAISQIVGKGITVNTYI